MLKIKKKLISAEVILPIIVITVFIIYFFRMWDVNLRIPFGYDGDALLQLASIKAMCETGWAYFNNRLGAPFGMNFFDYPSADGLFTLFLTILIFFTRDHFIILNVFYIMGYGLSFFSAYWAFRKFEISNWMSSAGALAFVCLPYHFLRGVNHLYLATYFIVPLLIVAAINIYPGCSAINSKVSEINKWKILIILLTGGMCGVYYAFFGIFFIIMVGAIGAIKEKKLSFLRKSFYSALLILFGVFINLAPNIVYRIMHGPNIQVGVRSPIESDIYGLRMTQLLIPMWGHKNETLANFGRTYHDNLMVTEATSSALGFAAGVGFLILLAVIFIGSGLRVDSRIKILAKINLAAILFTTVGGLGVVFALLVTPQFRGLNRVSIFIGFFSLLALLILFEASMSRWSSNAKVKKNFTSIFSVFLMVFVLYDQVPAGARGKNETLAKEFKQDKEFISTIEKSIKPNCNIYQLPNLKYPEVAPLHKEGYQVMLRPFLHSERLNWSYGGIKGRMGDAWNEEFNKLLIQDQLGALKNSQFCGIYVERLAYKDNGEAVEKELKKILFEKPFISANGNAAFYQFDPLSGGEIQPSTALNLGKGFYNWEVNDAGQRWAWGNRKAELKIFNFKDKNQVLIFEAELFSPNSSKVYFYSDEYAKEEVLLYKEENIFIQKKITLKPGINILKFETDLPAVKIGQDPRALSLRLMNPAIKSVKD